MCTPSMMVRWPSVMAAVDDGVDAHGDALGLLDEARLVGVAPVGQRNAHAGGGLERRGLDLGHEVGREEGAHDLAHGVGATTTRVMPRRWASWVASVLLPTPVVPPTRMTSGWARRVRFCHLRKRAMVSLPSASPSAAVAISCEALQGDRALAAVVQPLADRRGDLVGALGRQAGGHERLRHEALGVGQRRVARDDHHLDVVAHARITPAAPARAVAGAVVRSGLRAPRSAPSAAVGEPVDHGVEVAAVERRPARCRRTRAPCPARRRPRRRRRPPPP